MIGRWSPARPHAARRSMVHIYGDACGRGTACIAARLLLVLPSCCIYACMQAGRGGTAGRRSIDRRQAAILAGGASQPRSACAVAGPRRPNTRLTLPPFRLFFLRSMPSPDKHQGDRSMSLSYICLSGGCINNACDACQSLGRKQY